MFSESIPNAYHCLRCMGKRKMILNLQQENPLCIVLHSNVAKAKATAFSISYSHSQHSTSPSAFTYSMHILSIEKETILAHHYSYSRGPRHDKKNYEHLSFSFIIHVVSASTTAKNGTFQATCLFSVYLVLLGCLNLVGSR